MAGYYPSGCDQQSEHHCDPCEDREFGRVRSAGFIHKDYQILTPDDPAEWLAGIQSGAIILIPETNGEVSKGSAKMGPGYGETVETLLGYDFSGKFIDPNFKTNCTFYNNMVGKRSYKFFYRTSSQVFITDVPVTIIPNTEVKNDLNSEVVWEVDVKWTRNQFPCPATFPPDVFDSCFIPA